MTKRRLLIIALALVAIAAAVPVVPWAIVEWHVREIAADRQALLDALEAPGKPSTPDLQLRASVLDHRSTCNST